MPVIDSKFKRKLRAIGQGLKPVVTVASNGLTDPVIAEINRALDDHELIKIKIAGDRNDRVDVELVLSDFEATDVVQALGNTLLVYRPSKEPNLLTSNLADFHKDKPRQY